MGGNLGGGVAGSVWAMLEQVGGWPSEGAVSHRKENPWTIVLFIAVFEHSISNSTIHSVQYDFSPLALDMITSWQGPIQFSCRNFHRKSEKDVCLSHCHLDQFSFSFSVKQRNRKTMCECIVAVSEFCYTTQVSFPHLQHLRVSMMIRTRRTITAATATTTTPTITPTGEPVR